MVLIPVPKPPKSAMNPNRPVSKLLRNQMEHLQRAEFRLPLKQQTNIYINAIKTEGEAADYVRRVTQAIHSAHGIEPKGAAAGPSAVTPKRSPTGRDIAAVAEVRPTRKRKTMRTSKAKTKRKTRTKRNR
jgi:hypothetical protein